MPRTAAMPLWTAKRTCRVARISMAVPHVSQSPWAKWASPAENSPTLGVDRDEQAAAGPELLDVDVAGGLPWRDGAQRRGGDRRIGRHRVGGVWWQHEAAPVQRGLLPCGGLLQQRPVGGQADRPHERVTRDADARQVVGGRPRDFPQSTLCVL